MNSKILLICRDIEVYIQILRIGILIFIVLILLKSKILLVRLININKEFYMQIKKIFCRLNKRRNLFIYNHLISFQNSDERSLLLGNLYDKI